MHVCGVAQCVSCVVRVVSCVRFQWMYDCKLDEMRDPLESYKNLGEFFTRHLKEGVRPMGDGMVSPVDGRVLIFGEIKDEQVEQIKGTHAPAHTPPHTHDRTRTAAHGLTSFLYGTGLTYELESLLGDTKLHLKVQDKNEAQGRPDKKLYHVVIYLAPGDYHGIHTPVDMTVTHRRHFPGTYHLLARSPQAALTRELNLMRVRSCVVSCAVMCRVVRVVLHQATCSLLRRRW